MKNCSKRTNQVVGEPLYYVTCDASVPNGDNISGVAWRIEERSKNASDIIYENSKTEKTPYSVEAECIAIIRALEFIYKRDSNTSDKNLIINTDLENIEKHLDTSTRIKEKADNIKYLLEKFNSWVIRKVDREQVNRVDKLSRCVIEKE